MAVTKYYWGNDPGFTNSGVAVLTEKGEVVWSKSLDFSKEGFSKTLDQLPLNEYPPSAIVFERYVAYSGITTKYSEHILMGLGAILDRTRHSEQFFFRAIDWKSMLAKRAFKESGWVNPSTKFDKKFSKALATHLTGFTFKTDHEADAACLAYIGSIGLKGKEYGAG